MTIFEKLISIIARMNQVMPDDLFDIEMAGPEDKFDLDPDK